MARKPKPKCLFPPCKRPAHTRGLCMQDYTTAATLVKQGKTTWGKLEKQGRAAPPGGRHRTGATHWFLTGKIPAKSAEK
jgi:hypothetical protein